MPSEEPLLRSVYFTQPSLIKEWAAKYQHTFSRAVNLMCYGFLNQMETLDENYDRITQLEKEVELLTQEVSMLKVWKNNHDIDRIQNTPGGI